MFELTGKTALVTGATGTIGATIARSLHGQGATVAISGTRREVLDRLAAELGGRVHILPANLADLAETEALVPRAEEAMGQLDILVANAGVTRDNLLVQLRDEDWEQVIAINLSATFRLSRAAVRGMMRRRFGRVIAITSVVGITGNPGQANCVAPGFIVTPMTDKLNDKQRETIVAKIPASRAGTPAEVAAAVVFLASNEAGYMTGQTLHVNGGMAMI